MCLLSAKVKMLMPSGSIAGEEVAAHEVVVVTFVVYMYAIVCDLIVQVDMIHATPNNTKVELGTPDEEDGV